MQQAVAYTVFGADAAQTAAFQTVGIPVIAKNKGNTWVNKEYKVYVMMWGAFSWHGLGPLVESMPRSIEAVLPARGGPAPF